MRALRVWGEDGRFPRSSVDILSGWARVRSREPARAVAAGLRPGRGAPRGPVERSGATRWRVSGDVPVSLHDLRHVFAERVIGALRSAGVRPFLASADGPDLCFGVHVDDRPSAWTALGSLPRDEGWWVDWRRGSHVGSASLGDGTPPRALLRAEWWRIYRAFRVGQHAVAGAEQATELSFWVPGPDGEVERVGVRGHERFAVDAQPTEEDVDGRRYPGLDAFPVGRSLMRFREPVDAVYTWVDSDDPSWRADFERWVTRERPDTADHRSAHPSRYRSRDELRYSLRSLWLNAGWFRRVFVVTAGQRPPWLVPDERLTLVDHRELFPEDWLPTFNSHAIEARLHRIEGLAEHFVYVNDDVFFGRQCDVGTFFEPNGIWRFKESDERMPMVGSTSLDYAVDAALRNGQRLIFEAFGRIIERKLEHSAHALRRSVLLEIEERFPEVVERTARSRFRSPTDVSIASSFAHHYAYCTGRAVTGAIQVGYEHLESWRLRFFLERLLVARDMDVFCLNASDRSPGDGEAVDQLLGAFLDAYFPVCSPWER